MNNRQRFLDTLNFKRPSDRLPMLEWASWWDLTIDRWLQEGLPAGLQDDQIRTRLGTDWHRQFWISPRSGHYPETCHGQGLVTDLASYEVLRPLLYPADAVVKLRDQLLELKPQHDRGEVIIWLTLDGFFWFPRTLFGIESHLYSFYDEPELMHRINQDLTDYYLGLLDEISAVLHPDFMTFAEDMSYNLGPMLSRDLFDTFLLPCYRQIVPKLNQMKTRVLVDTDGQVEPMIPWLIDAGIEGILPLERQSGVDVVRIREAYSELIMIGAFDKRVMNLGEQAIREEFERLLPVMRTGGFIPSCDHQTPPSVSLDDYHLYVTLLREYCQKACT